METLTLKTATDVVKTEGPNRSSRDEGILASGSDVVECGTVLGKIGVGAAVSATKSGGNTGTGTLTLDATNPVRDGAKVGVYRVRLKTAAANGGVWAVTDPEGYDLGEVAVGAAFDNDLKFVTADGATDFIVGDGFDVTVALGSGKWAPLDFAAEDGSQHAGAILLEKADASDADARVVLLRRSAEVVSQALVWPVGATTLQKNAALAALEARGIVARTGV
jgi:hypothetical protein